MKKKTSRPLLTAGTSTLLLIFLSLCLLTFAVLSLLSARADRNLSRKTADRTTAYYEACNQAENRIGEIDGILEKIWKNTEGEEMYFQEIEIHFEDAENSESETGNSIYSWDSASAHFRFPYRWQIPRYWLSVLPSAIPRQAALFTPSPPGKP